MENLSQQYLSAEVTDGCAIEFIENEQSLFKPYVCGRCYALTALGRDGVTKIRGGQCEEFIYDGFES